MRGLKSLQRFGVAAMLLGTAGAALVALPVRASIDEATATVTDERLASGIPLGGIGAGKVELLTDGSFGNLTLNNNWDRPIAELPGSFFALRTRRAGADTSAVDARVLSLRSRYGFPAVSSVQYRGTFPRAQVRFADQGLPVEVNLHAFSSLIPHNRKDSSLPAALFTFTLTNRGPAPVEAALAFSWENVLGCGGNAKAAWNDRTGNTQAVKSGEGRAGLVFSTAQKHSGPKQSSLGEYAVLAEADGGKVSALPHWNAAGDGKEFWTALQSPTLFEDKPASQPGREGSVHPAGAVGATVTIPAEGSRQVQFVLAWRMPEAVTPDGIDHGHYYASTFPDAWSVATYAAQYRETLLSGTLDWQELLTKSNLPEWLKSKLLNDTFPLFTNTLYGKDESFLTLESAEGTVAGPDHWLLTRTLLSTFFPDLERRERKAYSGLQASSGEPPRSLGSLGEGFGTGDRLKMESWPDVACNYVLAALRDYRWTGSTDALKDAYPSVVRALEWLKSRDTDGDLIPEGGSTFSYQTNPGTFAYHASLYLATLRAAEELARVSLDKKTEDECRTRAAGVKMNAMSELWNGRFFTKSLNPANAERSSNLFGAALAGEWAGETLGLPELYDRRVVETGFRSIVDVLGSAAPFSPPNETRPDGALDPDLAEHSWAGHLETYVGALGISLNRADSGLELLQRIHNVQYGVARSPWDASLGYHPRTAQRVGGRYHVATLGSWNAYTALTGLTLDEPGGNLGVSPALPTSWEDLSVPVFTPRYWAMLDFARNPNNAATNLRLRLLKKFDDRPITLNSITTTAPAGAALEELTILVSGPDGPAAGKPELANRKLKYTFTAPFQWDLGETLEVTLVPPDANNVLLNFEQGRVTSYGSAVGAKDLKQDGQTRFTLVNPTRERQIVNVRFQGTKDRTYQVFQNGIQTPRFTPDSTEERLPILVPASPVAGPRIERLRRTQERLRAAEEQAREAGKLDALQSQLAPLREKIAAAVAADETARSTQVVLAPARKGLSKNKLKDPPPIILGSDPEPTVVAAEEAVAQAASVTAEQVPDAAARGILLAALNPVQVEAEALEQPSPGGTLRLRMTVSNESQQPVRAAFDLGFPQGWSAPAVPPRLEAAPGQTASVEVPVRLPANLEARRELLKGRAVLTAGEATWETPLSLRVGHAWVRNWSVIGPWVENASLDTQLPPDTELDPSKAYDGRRWRAANAGESGRVNLASESGQGEKGVAYAVTQVFSPTDQEVVLELVTDGGVAVKVNGERLFQRSGAPAAEGAGTPVRVPARLRQGSNTVVLKLSRAGQAWGFAAEIADRNGNTLSGLRFTPLGQ